MKKILFFAATAMLFAACANEEADAPVVAQEGNNGAVLFDTYTSAATRAGYAGVMTTEKLKTDGIGFGVYTFYQDDDTDYPANNTTLTPNFMFNQQVTWAGGWSYSPLKYWPNETTSDMLNATGHASSSATDKLSFFAYAPYVDLTTAGTLTGSTDAYVDDAVGATGIVGISKETVASDPKVEWKVTANPDNNVDLLWGVAPAGLSYVAVNGSTINTTEGKPIVNMVKPDKDQKIKFLFEHALSRIGLTVVSAIDQVADGGTFNTTESRVLIDEVKIYGSFGTQGVLNLNNETAHVANWIESTVTRTPSSEGSPLFTINATNGYLNPVLRYDAAQITTIAGDASAFSGLNTGVLTREQNLMVGGADPSKKVTDPDYAFGTTLYVFDDPDYVVAKAKTPAATKVYSKDGDNYTQVYDGAGTGYEVDGTTPFYTLAVTSSGHIDAGVDYWTVSGTTYTKTVAGVDGQYLDASNVTLEATPVTATYTAGDYYTALTPRYFMVIPSDLTPTPTEINVKITYHVVTKDTKLTGNVSNVTNAITKTTSIQLKNGKSYNLKLILGLTSVKLDATVKDWEVADETEINLPKNED